MRVFFRSEKVKRNIRLIAHDPTIVTGTDVKDVSGLHDVRSSILHRACSLSRDHHTDVLHLTKGSPGNWRDVLRPSPAGLIRSEEHTSELQSQSNLVCRLLLEKKKHVGYRHIVQLR